MQQLNFREYFDFVNILREVIFLTELKLILSYTATKVPNVFNSSITKVYSSTGPVLYQVKILARK
jgi:hypothetical protein